LISTFAVVVMITFQVDSWAPLWLGGHIVGFGSFFAYMWLTNADLMKTDQLLEREDAPPSPLAEIKHRVKLARLEAKLLEEEQRKQRLASSSSSQPQSAAIASDRAL
jgi:hypothetical protein